MEGFGQELQASPVRVTERAEVSVVTIIDGHVFTVFEGILPADRLSEPSWRTNSDHPNPKPRC